jgi:hypothetical protein
VVTLHSSLFFGCMLVFVFPIIIHLPECCFHSLDSSFSCLVFFSGEELDIGHKNYSLDIVLLIDSTSSTCVGSRVS